MLKLLLSQLQLHSCKTTQRCLIEGAPVVQASSLGVTAKVADFGLSRDMLCASKIETRTCGTITHMPPELLSSDVMSKVSPSSFLSASCRSRWIAVCQCPGVPVKEVFARICLSAPTTPLSM